MNIIVVWSNGLLETNMNFTEYRSKALKGLWLKGFNRDNICGHRKFRISRIDNICANNWKTDNPISICIAALYSYLKEDII